MVFVALRGGGGPTARRVRNHPLPCARRESWTSGSARSFYSTTLTTDTRVGNLLKTDLERLKYANSAQNISSLDRDREQRRPPEVALCLARRSEENSNNNNTMISEHGSAVIVVAAAGRRRASVVPKIIQ